MNTYKNESKGSGLGVEMLIFLIFLTLKLGGWGVVATWSWWWVFSPLWIPILIIWLVRIILYFITL